LQRNIAYPCGTDVYACLSKTRLRQFGLLGHAVGPVIEEVSPQFAPPPALVSTFLHVGEGSSSQLKMRPSEMTTLVAIDENGRMHFDDRL